MHVCSHYVDFDDNINILSFLSAIATHEVFPVTVLNIDSLILVLANCRTPEVLHNVFTLSVLSGQYLAFLKVIDIKPRFHGVRPTLDSYNDMF